VDVAEDTQRHLVVGDRGWKRGQVGRRNDSGSGLRGVGALRFVGEAGWCVTAISSAISAPQCGMPPSGVATETGVSGTTVRLAGSYTRWWRKTSRARP
jgi:hypothetical protein